MGNERGWSRDVIRVGRVRTYPGPIPHKLAGSERIVVPRPVLSDAQGAAAPGRGFSDGSPPSPARPWLKAPVLLVRFPDPEAVAGAVCVLAVASGAGRCSSRLPGAPPGWSAHEQIDVQNLTSTTCGTPATHWPLSRVQACVT